MTIGYGCDGEGPYHGSIGGLGVEPLRQSVSYGLDKGRLACTY